MNENICAISTSLGVGAISIVRASGPDVVSIVNKIFKSKDLNKVKTHTINYGFIVDKKEVIDEVLVSVMLAPKTYTMEDLVEINCHGGITTTNKILELLLENGCRMAEPGEFTKKAFLNGRIDKIEAEAINDLISSESEEQRKYAISRVSGNLSKLIEDNRSILLDLQTKLEVNFDYPEETDNIDMTHELVKSNLLIIKKSLEKLINDSKDTKIIKSGIDIAIVGSPNVGKSSILNHLLDENKAIVTNIAGTTRDIVEGSITLDGIKVNLIDTAGIHETDDVVEKIGVDRSKEAIKHADLVICVIDGSRKLTEEELDLINSINGNKIIFVNKNDLNIDLKLDKLENNNIIYGNTVDKNGLDALKEKIVDMFKIEEIKAKNYNFLSNASDIASIKNAYNSILNAIKSVDDRMPLEMISVDIKDAFDNLGDIIGATYRDEIIDEMFKKFCLGK